MTSGPGMGPDMLLDMTVALTDPSGGVDSGPQPCHDDAAMHMTSPSRRPLFVFLLALGLSLLHAADAHAYFDPASGSLVLQMILGGIAGVALMVRIYWHKVLGLFGVNTPDPRDDEDADDAEDADDSEEEDTEGDDTGRD